MQNINQQENLSETNNKNDNNKLLGIVSETKESINKIEIKEFLKMLEDTKKQHTFFGSDDIKIDIDEYLNKFISNTKNKIVLYDIKVNKIEENLSKDIIDKLPFMLKRYAFDREWFTWVRYYVFISEENLKIAVWFYGWSAWRWNDSDFWDFFRENARVVDFNLSDIIKIYE